MFRKIVFWAHLVAGVLVGLIVLKNAVTGTLMAYEYQMIESADMRMLASENTEAAPLPLEEIMSIAGEELNTNITGVVIRNVEGAPYQVSYDRRGATYVDPYSGEVLGIGSQTTRDVLGYIRNWHRWFNVNGEGRETARAISGAANATFGFILLTGLYLWFPKMWKAAAFKMRFWFKKNPTSKARDYNWHHVFGIWTFVPLLAIVFTGMGFSYPAVKDFVNRLAAEPGQEQVQQGGPPQGGGQQPPPGPAIPPITAPANAAPLSLDALVAITQNELGDGWYQIAAAPARNPSSPVEMKISLERSKAPSKELNLYLNPYTGDIAGEYGWDQKSRQEKAAGAMRRVHTGEYFGIIGQTIAAIVAIFLCIMVWTGLALAWRRLVSPLLAKRT